VNFKKLGTISLFLKTQKKEKFFTIFCSFFTNYVGKKCGEKRADIFEKKIFKNVFHSV
jgi:hypothetical protein